MPVERIVWTKPTRFSEIAVSWKCVCGAHGTAWVTPLADDAAIKSAFYWEHNRINPKCSAAYGTSFCTWEKGIGR